MLLGRLADQAEQYRQRAQLPAEARRGEHGPANPVTAYLGYLMDAYLFEECCRYDVKGKDYFDYPNKYYCDDVGLRKARTGFRKQEKDRAEPER